VPNDYQGENETKIQMIILSKEEYWDEVTTMSTFIKQLERDQLESRAIASSTIFRIFVTLAEEFFKQLLSFLEERVICMSSSDKKMVLKVFCLERKK